VLLATAALVVHAAQTAQWTAAAVVALFLAVFVYQIGQFFYRNQPRRYPPDQIPAAVMPHIDD
jgi:predicted membrane channel-forming protein YqfA (hemolysin III family)